MKDELATLRFHVQWVTDISNPDSEGVGARKVKFKKMLDALDEQEANEERILYEWKKHCEMARREREAMEEDEHRLEMSRRKNRMEEKRSMMMMDEVEVYGQH